MAMVETRSRQDLFPPGRQPRRRGFKDLRAFYNGYYGCRGARIQHLVEVDGIIFSYCCALRFHDSLGLATDFFHLVEVDT